MIIGNRIPYEYFATSGKGESNAGSEGLKYETGSYDAALTDAGIQNCNILEYTSVIPTNAKQISREEGVKRINWGEAMECIKAQANGDKGQFVSTAVLTTDVFDDNNKYLGGFALEYSGSGTKQEAIKSLAVSLKGLIERRGYGLIKHEVELFKDNITSKNYRLHPGKIFLYDSLKVTKEHGSVFCALCWVSYRYPQLSNKSKTKKRRSKE